MRNVVFKKVGMVNFGPYIDKMEYEIKPNTLTLITGPNGVGKTMMLDAIPYTLFGITSKGMKGDDVVNNVVGKDCHTWLEFEVNGQAYTVNRYQNYKGRNNVKLEKDGEVLCQGQKEVVPLLESMIQPKQLFMNTLMFGQKVKDFFTDLGDAKQKEIFRMILNLDNYLIYYENSKKAMKQIDQKVLDCQKKKSVSLELISDITENLSLLEQKKIDFYEEKEKSLKECVEKLAQLERFKSGWEEKIKQLEPSVQDLARIESDIKDVEKLIREIDQKYQTEIDKIEGDKNNALQRLYAGFQERTTAEKEKYEPTITDLESQIEKLNETLRQENDKINFNTNEHTARKSELESDIRYLNIDINKLLEVKKRGGGKCPTCFQEITNFDHIDIELNKINMKLKECEKELNAINLKYKHLIDDLKNGAIGVQQNIDGARKTLNEVKTELSDNLSELNDKLKEKIEEVESMANTFKKRKIEEKPKEKSKLDENLSQLLLDQKNCKEYVDDLEQAKNSLSKVENDLSATNERKQYIENMTFDGSEIERQNKRMKTITKEMEQFEKQEKLLERERKVTEFWKQSFSSSGIPSMLIDEAIPFMNETVSTYLETISNGRYIVSFDTLAETKSGEIRDKISVRVLDTISKANNRLQFSGGQTRIVDIATILTLGDLQSKVQNVSFNILLFDEIFDSLDDENIGYVSRVLRKLTDKTILIISHRHVDQLEAEEVYSLQ
jgi:DNA repair exonuclease SbcCD ATPase subunit